MDGLDIKLLWGTYALMWAGPRESSTASASMRHLRYFHFSTPTSRASSSQNFEHPLPPPPRRFRAENAARHAAEISGDSRRKICEKVLKISAGHFLKIFEKYFFRTFPFKFPKDFKGKMLKFSPRASRAALPYFPLNSIMI